MPRPLVFGNPRTLVAVDARHRIRDLYWPNIGHPNHISGKAVAFGVYAEGRMSWSDSQEWMIQMTSEPGALVAKCVLENNILGLRLETVEALDPILDIFVRRIVVRNLKPTERAVTLFWNHELLMDESNIGNTCLYHPGLRGMIHYKRQNYAAFVCRSEGAGPSQWSCGVRVAPADGCWRQCDHGVLDGKAMEVGAVDSTMGLTLRLEPLGQGEADWGLLLGSTMEEVVELGAELDRRGWDSVIENRRERDSLRAKTLSLPKALAVNPRYVEAAERALLVIETQCHQEGGILAGNDSDTMTGNTLNYSNVWPRDGALVAEALLSAGATDLASRYMEFSLRTLPGDGMYRQKYWPDGSLGVSWHPMVWKGKEIVPFQEDETALSVWFGARCCLLGGVDISESRIADGLMAPGGEAMLAYRDESGLPLPSWDLWEERRGVSFFTVCSVIVALRKAGTVQDRADFAVAADKMSQAALAKMVGPDGAFVRQLTEEGDQDPIVDSAMIAGLVLGAFDLSLPQVTATLEKVRRVLLDSSPSGGAPRYEGDTYHRRSDAFPGSPWIICTLWIAQLETMMGHDLAEVYRILDWCLNLAGPTGILPESIDPYTSEHLSVSPLTWSHAELLRTMTMLEERLSRM